jgi:hypothetical protein
MRGADKQMSKRKESNMFNSVNQKIPTMNKGERKELSSSTRKKNKIIGITIIILI